MYHPQVLWPLQDPETKKVQMNEGVDVCSDGVHKCKQILPQVISQEGHHSRKITHSGYYFYSYFLMSFQNYLFIFFLFTFFYLILIFSRWLNSPRTFMAMVKCLSCLGTSFSDWLQVVGKKGVINLARVGKLCHVPGFSKHQWRCFIKMGHREPSLLLYYTSRLKLTNHLYLCKLNTFFILHRHFNRGGYKHHDDPGLYFKLEEPALLKKLAHTTVFDLPIGKWSKVFTSMLIVTPLYGLKPHHIHSCCLIFSCPYQHSRILLPYLFVLTGDKLKILNTLIGQILTYASLRDTIDDNIEELKKVKNVLRVHQQHAGRHEKEIQAARYNDILWQHVLFLTVYQFFSMFDIHVHILNISLKTVYLSYKKCLRVIFPKVQESEAENCVLNCSGNKKYCYYLLHYLSTASLKAFHCFPFAQLGSVISHSLHFSSHSLLS